jgi:hypothetical protein
VITLQLKAGPEKTLPDVTLVTPATATSGTGTTAGGFFTEKYLLIALSFSDVRDQLHSWFRKPITLPRLNVLTSSQQNQPDHSTDKLLI